MLILVLLALTSAVASAQKCPVKYARFSTKHSFCLKPNDRCEIVHRGVEDEDKKTILDAHNSYRSRVALGKEEEAGGLPPASNMMEMDWDTELQAVAQKWAAQCKFEHDCSNCNSVENFIVGQNLAYEDVFACSDEACLSEATKPNWDEMITLFYDEVKLFKKQLVNKFQFDMKYGHFTQVAWADTWKIGCGYVVFKNGEWLRKLYVCNYGPTGNVLNEKMYEAGKPCSKCPSNAYCGSSKTHSYPGLCVLNNKKQGPFYETSTENSLINCNWRNSESTCNFKVSGQQNWKLKPSLGGYYITILLKGGEKTSLALMTPIAPKSESFCLVVVYRKTTTDASEMDSSHMTLDMYMDSWSSQMTMRSSFTEFSPYSIHIRWGDKTKIVINFSVPSNAPNHIIDLKEVSAYDGKCKSKDDK